MKKLIIIIGAVVTVALFGFGFYQLNTTVTNPKLSAEEIKSMVENQYPGEITKLELEKDQDQAVYELEINDDGKEYALTLDGNTGKVIHLTEKGSAPNQMKAQQTNSSETKQQEQKWERKQQMEQVGEFISICKAAEIAQQQNKGVMEDIELESDKGEYYYEAKVRNDQEKIKLTIDAKTGKVMDIRTETKDHSSKTMKQVEKQGKTMISFCQVAEIALKEYPGIVGEIELEEEDGKLVYDVKVYDDSAKVSVKIDALTGEILVIKMDD